MALGDDTGGLAFSPDGRELLTGSDDGGVHRWNPKTGAHLGHFGDPVATLGHIVATRNGSVALATSNGTIVLWSTANGESQEPIAADGVTSLLFGPDGNRLVMSNPQGTQGIDLATRARTALVPAAAGEAVALGPNDVVVCFRDGGYPVNAVGGYPEGIGHTKRVPRYSAEGDAGPCRASLA